MSSDQTDREEQLGLSVNVSKSEFERAITRAVQEQTLTISSELKEQIVAKQDEFRKQIDALLSKSDSLDDRVHTRIAKVDESLEKLQEKIEKRVNRYVIPSVVFIVCSLALAVFVALGGFGAITGVKSLKDRVDASNTAMKQIDGDISALGRKIGEMKSQADADRIGKLEDDFNKLRDRFNTYMDAEATKATKKK